MASVTGRIVNFISRRLPGLGHWGTRRQVAQFRASKGSKGNKIMGKPTFLLDVVGRKCYHFWLLGVGVLHILDKSPSI